MCRCPECKKCRGEGTGCWSERVAQGDGSLIRTLCDFGYAYPRRRHGGRSILGMRTSIQTTHEQSGLVAEGLVARARWVWYGIRPIWWRSCWGLRVSGLENLPKNG